MKGILLKDWYAVRVGKYWSVLIIALFTVLAVMKTDGIFIFLPILWESTSISNLIIRDFSDRWSGYSVVFPVKKSYAVTARYLEAVIMLIFCAVIGFAAYNICNVIGYKVDIKYGLSMAFAAVLYLIMVTGDIFLAISRFNYRLRTAYIMLKAGVFIALYSVGFSEDVGIYNLIVSNYKLQTALCVVAAVIVFAASMPLAVKLYEKREFM